MVTPNPMAGRLRIGGVVSAILLVVVGMKLYGPHRRLEPSVASVSSRPAPIGPTPSSAQRPMTVAKDEPGEHPDRGRIPTTVQKPAISGSEPNPTLSTDPSNFKVSTITRNTKTVTDPWARVALAYVGLDEEATAYWLAAINDASLPPEERKDLIEDLNEDGFRDPDHPAPDEYGLIFNRLMLLEAMAPSAMDEVNFEAMAEAFKDLINMARDAGSE